MAPNEEAYAILNFGVGLEEMHFSSHPELKKHVRAELAFVDGVLREGGPSLHGLADDRRSAVQSATKRLRECLETCSNERVSDDFVTLVKCLYSDEQVLLHSNSPISRYIESVGNSPMFRQAARLCFMIRPGSAGDNNVTKGLNAAIAWCLAESARLKFVPSDELHLRQASKLYSELSERALQLDQAIQNAEERLTVGKRLAERLATTQESYDSQLNDEAQEFRSEIRDKLLKEAEDTIKEAKEYVTNQVSLEAPVAYWSEVIAEKRDTATRFSIYAVILAAVIVVLNAYLAQWILGAKSIAEVQALHITSLAVANLIAIWLMKIFVRVILSSLHLQSDARERKAIIQTFLALQRGGHVGQSDLGVILKSVFREAHSGLFKEDATAPTLVQDIHNKLTGSP